MWGVWRGGLFDHDNDERDSLMKITGLCKLQGILYWKVLYNYLLSLYELRPLGLVDEFKLKIFQNICPVHTSEDGGGVVMEVGL